MTKTQSKKENASKDSEMDMAVDLFARLFLDQIFWEEKKRRTAQLDEGVNKDQISIGGKSLA